LKDIQDRFRSYVRCGLLLNSFPGLLDVALHAVGLADLFSSCFPNDKTIVESLNACYDCEQLPIECRLSASYLLNFTRFLFCTTACGNMGGHIPESRRVIVFSIDFESDTRGTLRI